MITLANVFQDGMILQCGKQIEIWGQADIGVWITAEIQGKKSDGVVASDHTWHLTIPALDPSFSECLIIKTEQEEKEFKDIAIGEVWIAAGQSNMEFPLIYEKNWRKGNETRNSQVRFYDVPEISFDGQDAVFDYSKVGIWRQGDCEELNYFSAIGYYFANELQKDLHIPIGIIGCNFGGTRSAAWMSRSSVEKAGNAWNDLQEELMSGMDMDEYWEEQKHNVINDRGLPCSDEFSRLVLPETPDEEKINAFWAAFSEDVDLSSMAIMPQTIPGCLYEHMVKTIAPYTVRGVLWYQGESDDVPGMQHLYGAMLEAMLSDWRDLWGNPSMPFLIVQIPGWSRWMGDENHDYMTIRKAQEKIANNDESVWLCSISDLGEEKDIHPKEKKEAGRRLSLLARNHIYGEESLLCDAPALQKAEMQDGKLVLSFINVEGGLFVKGETPDDLHVLSDDGQECGFTCEVNNERLILSLEKSTPKPAWVKMAQSKWYKVNIYNRSGISALPFDAAVCSHTES